MIDYGKISELLQEARRQERERCAKIADKYIERANADIAHAIANEIRNSN